MEMPILGYFGGLGLLFGIKLFPVQNLTSYSCSATPIFYKGDEISRLTCLMTEIWHGTDVTTETEGSYAYGVQA